MVRRITIGLALVVALPGMAQAQTVIYVDASADQTPHDGSTWCHAYLELHEALDAPGSDTVIRVANGTYLPDSSGLGDPREATFQLANGVNIEGGYAGCNDGGDLRDVALYQTILSGDLSADDNPDDFPGGPSYSDNSYHVVTGSGTDSTAVLDGLTITSGNATGPHPHVSGGGMQNYGSSGNPTVANCIFTGNSAADNGGGMHNSSNSSPTLTGCAFIDNSGGVHGGGMRNNNSSNPMLTNCTFCGNTADYGGGMFNDYESTPTLTNCSFIGNQAQDDGGGMYNGYSSSPTLVDCIFIANRTEDPDGDGDGGGGMCNSHSSPTLTNCIFIGNRAEDDGGGMYNWDNSNPTLANCIFSANWAAEDGGGMRNRYDSSPTLTNCIFIGNRAEHDGGGMYNWENSNPTLTNCILWADMPDELYNSSSSPVVTYSCVQGGWSGNGNISGNPMFGGDFRLMPGSPCIDAGNNAGVPAGVITDLHGLPRFFDDSATPDTGLGDPPIVDMGAYEYVVVVPAGSADLDGDGDVDMDDFNLFQQQFTGPQP